MSTIPSNEDRQRQYQADRTQREVLAALHDSRSEMKRLEHEISEFGSALGTVFKSLSKFQDTLNKDRGNGKKVDAVDSKNFLSASVIRNLGKEMAKQMLSTSSIKDNVSLAQAIANIKSTQRLSERNAIDKLRYGKGSLSELEKQVKDIGDIYADKAEDIIEALDDQAKAIVKSNMDADKSSKSQFDKMAAAIEKLPAAFKDERVTELLKQVKTGNAEQQQYTAAMLSLSAYGDKNALNSKLVEKGQLEVYRTSLKSIEQSGKFASELMSAGIYNAGSASYNQVRMFAANAATNLFDHNILADASKVANFNDEGVGQEEQRKIQSSVNVLLAQGFKQNNMAIITELQRSFKDPITEENLSEAIDQFVSKMSTELGLKSMVELVSDVKEKNDMSRHIVADLGRAAIKANTSVGALATLLSKDGLKGAKSYAMQKLTDPNETAKHLRVLSNGLKSVSHAVMDFNDAGVIDTFVNTFTSGYRGLSMSESQAVSAENKSFQAINGMGFEEYKRRTEGIYSIIGASTGLSEKQISKVLPAINESAEASGVNVKNANAMNRFVSGFIGGFSKMRGVFDLSIAQYAALNKELVTSTESTEMMNGMTADQRVLFAQDLVKTRNKLALDTRSMEIGQKLIANQMKYVNMGVKEKHTSVAKTQALMATVGVSPRDAQRYANINRSGGPRNNEDMEFIRSIDAQTVSNYNSMFGSARERGDQATMDSLSMVREHLGGSIDFATIQSSLIAQQAGTNVDLATAIGAGKAAEGDKGVKTLADLYNSVMSYSPALTVAGSSLMLAGAGAMSKAAYSRIGKMLGKGGSSGAIPATAGTGSAGTSSSIMNGLGSTAKFAAKAATPVAIAYNVYNAAYGGEEGESRGSKWGKAIGSVVGGVGGGLVAGAFTGGIGAVGGGLAGSYLGEKVGGSIGNWISGSPSTPNQQTPNQSEQPTSATTVPNSVLNGFQFADDGSLYVADRAVRESITSLTASVDKLLASLPVKPDTPTDMARRRASALPNAYSMMANGQ